MISRGFLFLLCRNQSLQQILVETLLCANHSYELQRHSSDQDRKVPEICLHSNGEAGKRVNKMYRLQLYDNENKQGDKE